MIDFRGSRRLAAGLVLVALGSGSSRAQVVPPKTGPSLQGSVKAPVPALPGPRTITSPPLVLAGRDSGARVVDAPTLVLAGRDTGPRTVDAATLVLAGRDTGPRTVDSPKIVLSGRRK